MGCEETLSRKSESLFQDAQVRTEVLTLLETYGEEDYENETSRVKLAILELAGSDLNGVRVTVYLSQEKLEIK